MNLTNKKIEISVADNDYMLQKIPITESTKQNYLQIILIVCAMLIVFFKPEFLKVIYSNLANWPGLPLIILILFLSFIPYFKTKKRCFKINNNQLIITDKDGQLSINVSDIKNIYVELISATEILKMIVISTNDTKYVVLKENNISEFAKLKAFLYSNFQEQTDKNMLDENVEKILNNKKLFFLEYFSFSNRILFFSIIGILSILLFIGIAYIVLWLLTH